MSCADIANNFPHFTICWGTVFLFPDDFPLGHFVPKLRPTGPQQKGPHASPAQRVAWGEEERRSERAFGFSWKRGIRSP